MNARNFNFAPKFLQNGGFSRTSFVFIFGRKFSDRLKFGERRTGGGGIAPAFAARTSV